MVHKPIKYSVLISASKRVLAERNLKLLTQNLCGKKFYNFRLDSVKNEHFGLSLQNFCSVEGLDPTADHISNEFGQLKVDFINAHARV